MKHSSLPLVLLLFLGCSSDPASPSRADSADLTGSLECVVVEVVDDNVLEEGLGSIYDIDLDGFGESDGDSLEVRLQRSTFSVLSSGMILDIGQVSFGLHSPGDRIEDVPDEDGVIAWEAQLEGSDTVFTVRVFEDHGLGWILTTEPGAFRLPLAKIDCRDGVSVPDVFL